MVSEQKNRYTGLEIAVAAQKDGVIAEAPQLNRPNRLCVQKYIRKLNIHP
jgi:hypothetical protein